jgi:AcrB/AcrD/AcrF family/YtkA-like
VVMLLYLDQAFDKYRLAGRMNNIGDLYAAVKEGAVQRIRPKMMTVCAILFGLLPIMWSPALQAGADVMKRIATPMIGGVITSAILNLVLYPVIYVIWRKRELPPEGQVESRPLIAPGQRRRWLVRFLIIALVAAALFGGGFAAWNWWISRSQSVAQVQGEPIATRTVGELTISLYGDLRSGQSDVLIRFADATGQPKDVGEVKTDLSMNMTGMVMHSGGDVTKTSTLGVYRTKLQPQMGGDWVVKLSWRGPSGEGQVEIPVNVKQ